MRHRVAKRHLSRSPAHRKAMCRNLAQSLFQHGQVETTLVKAKEVQPFVERLITLARKGTLQSRRRVNSMLTDRSILNQEEQEQYEAMTDTQRSKVLVARSGRRHRSGQVPASYNKKKIPFVAQSVVRKLVTEIAPSFSDRPGGYTRIIRLAKRRIGDNSDLAILQLVGEEETTDSGSKKTVGQRRQKTLDRIRYLEGKKPKRSRKRGDKDSDSVSKAKSEEPAAKDEKVESSTEAGGTEKPEGDSQATPESKDE